MASASFFPGPSPRKPGRSHGFRAKPSRHITRWEGGRRPGDPSNESQGLVGGGEARWKPGKPPTSHRDSLVVVGADGSRRMKQTTRLRRLGPWLSVKRIKKLKKTHLGP